jgi:hypothetical protein
VPDVFYLQPNADYPINFTGQSFPGTPTINTLNYSDFMLPLGNAMLNSPPMGSFGDSNLNNNAFVSSTPSLGVTGSGIFGADYTVAAGIYKNLSVAGQSVDLNGVLQPVPVPPAAYDLVDNNNDGLIDNQADWNTTGQFAGIMPPPTFNLGSHTHNTARAEMLYAILVQGIGPWGSVFAREEFTDREVKDTDGDGLPEFVDAWGQPLQFFRWPLLYHSDLQRGQYIVPDTNNAQTWDLVFPYQGPDTANGNLNSAEAPFQRREQDPLDLNQTLVAPAWWSGAATANNNFSLGNPSTIAGPAPNVGASHAVQAFEYFFHRLTEPLVVPGGDVTGRFWDRGSYPNRRAFYHKFLILSGGPDLQPGVFLYADSDFAGMGNPAHYLIANENNALPFALDLLGGGITGFTTKERIPVSPGQTYPQIIGTKPSDDPTHPNSYDLQQAGHDDISNHNLQAIGGIGGSGS